MSFWTRDTPQSNHKTHRLPTEQQLSSGILVQTPLPSSTRTRKAVSPTVSSQTLDTFLEDQPRRQQESPVLAIPPELRDGIYTAALSGSSDLALLQTCRQINMEAQPALFQRPVTHSSQASLFAWAEDTTRQTSGVLPSWLYGSPMSTYHACLAMISAKHMPIKMPGYCTNKNWSDSTAHSNGYPTL